MHYWSFAQPNILRRILIVWLVCFGMVWLSGCVTMTKRQFKFNQDVMWVLGYTACKDGVTSEAYQHTLRGEK